MNDIITIDFLDNYDFSKPIPFSRTKCMDIKYERYKKKIGKMGLTNKEHILSNVICNNDYVIEKNQFPYNIDNNLYHYIYWVHPNFEKKHTNKVIIENINKFIEGKFDGYWCWENHDSVKSIPEIKHYQIISIKC